jgi:hypothetical protein
MMVLDTLFLSIDIDLQKLQKSHFAYVTGGRGGRRQKLAAARDWQWGGVEHEPLVASPIFFCRCPWGAPAGLNEHAE